MQCALQLGVQATNADTGYVYISYGGQLAVPDIYAQWNDRRISIRDRLKRSIRLDPSCEYTGAELVRIIDWLETLERLRADSL